MKTACDPCAWVSATTTRQSRRKLPGRIQGIAQSPHADYVNALRRPFWHVADRHDCLVEPLLGSCGDTLGAESDGTNLASKTDFTETYQPIRSSSVAKTGHNSQQDRQVDGRLANAQTADDIDEYVFITDSEAAMFL